MKTCSDCLYYEVCAEVMKQQLYIKEVLCGQKNPVCPQFTNRSEWVHLPCHIGDTVYEVFQNCYGETTIYAAEVYAIELREPQYESFIKTHYKNNGKNANFQFSELGDTIFLTREEAEKELEKMKENNEA